MLNIDEIMNGVVIDHITAGTGLSLYHLLELEKLSEASVIKCTNPRCITSLETGCDHIFALTPSGRYRCVYCEQEFKVRP